MAVNCSPFNLAWIQATYQRQKAESPNPQMIRSLTFPVNETSPFPAVAAYCREYVALWQQILVLNTACFQLLLLAQEWQYPTVLQGVEPGCT